MIPKWLNRIKCAIKWDQLLICNQLFSNKQFGMRSGCRCRRRIPVYTFIHKQTKRKRDKIGHRIRRYRRANIHRNFMGKRVGLIKKGTEYWGDKSGCKVTAHVPFNGDLQHCSILITISEILKSSLKIIEWNVRVASSKCMRRLKIIFGLFSSSALLEYLFSTTANKFAKKMEWEVMKRRSTNREWWISVWYGEV